MASNAYGYGTNRYAFADVNGDGFLDIVVAPTFDWNLPFLPMQIWLNRGDGTFYEATNQIIDGVPPTTCAPVQTIVGDVNGDGRPDIFVIDSGDEFAVDYHFPQAQQGCKNTLLLSQPNGKYKDASSQITPGTVTFYHHGGIGDIDGSGHLSFAVNSFGTDYVQNSGIQLLKGDGRGNFVETIQGLPQDIAWGPWLGWHCCGLTPDYQFTGAAALADLDGDGRAELITCSYSDPDGGGAHRQDPNRGHYRTVRFYKRMSDGTFVEAGRVYIPDAISQIGYLSPTLGTGYRGLGCNQILVGDLNGDGRPDIVTRWEGYGTYITVWRNDGNFQFTDVTVDALGGYNIAYTDSFGHQIAPGIQLLDVNGDGKLDLILDQAWVAYDSILPHVGYLNDGTGHFIPWVLQKANGPLTAADLFSVLQPPWWFNPKFIPLVFDTNRSGLASLVVLDPESSLVQPYGEPSTIYLSAFVPTSTVQAPGLSAISPPAIQAGTLQGVTLTLTVSNIQAGVTVLWNGSPRPTTVVDQNTLSVQITATDLLTAGTATVQVQNPGAPPSNAVTFTIPSAPLPSPTTVPSASQLRYVPHVVAGGGFVTRLIFANLVRAQNDVTVNSVSQAGSLVSSTPYALAPGATLLLAGDDAQRSLPLTTRWLATGSSATIGASALFDCCAAGPQVTSAVGVLAQTPDTSFTAPFVFQRAAANQPVLVEGLALANTSAAANTITVRLLDENGNQVSTDTLATMSAFGQRAFTVSDLPNVAAQLANVSSFLGSLVITGTQPFAPVIVGNLGGRLFSLPLVSSSSTNNLAIVPHFVTGGGFVTRVLIKNLASSQNQLTLQTLNQNGSTASTETVTLQAGQTILRTGGEASRSLPSQTQWLAISGSQPLLASALFDCCATGTDVTSAVGVLSQSPGTSFTSPFIFQRQTTSQPVLVQGLGIANRSTTSNTVIVRLFDQSGAQVSADTLSPIAPSGQTAFTISDLPNVTSFLQGRNSFVGSLAISGTQPLAPVVVGNLGGRLFSLPLTAQ